MHGFGCDRVWVLGGGGERIKRRWSRVVNCLVGLGLLIPSCCGWAQVATTLNGPPVEVTPYVQEPGVPLITMVPGTASLPPGAGGGSGTSTATGGGSGEGDAGSGGGGSDPLGTMLSTSWGITAIGNAEAVGINPAALAATCVLESGCGTDVGSSGAQGVFQMFPAAFQEGLQTALGANPRLAPQIVPGSAGMTDPTTEAIAASGYLLQAANSLESAGVSSPTVLDVRGYYNFGPSNGSTLATAQDSETMASILYNVSPQTLATNGIAPGETVGQWRASVAGLIGNAAGQPVSL
ncbi:MAG: hypothetical protein ACREFP_23940 [Acetobacteraceae bacterium]